jgi:NaMN:DMB phosphoribosyltransferase
MTMRHRLLMTALALVGAYIAFAAGLVLLAGTTSLYTAGAVLRDSPVVHEHCRQLCNALTEM